MLGLGLKSLGLNVRVKGLGFRVSLFWSFRSSFGFSTQAVEPGANQNPKPQAANPHP